jgi:hypothetical protein
VVRAHLRDAPPRVSELRKGLPVELDDVLARGLSKVPKRRFASCSALLAAAAEALEGVEILDLAPPTMSSGGDQAGVVTLIDLPPIKAEGERRGGVLLAALDPQTRALTRVALAGRYEIEEADQEADGELEARVAALALKQRPDLLVLDWEAGGVGARGIVAALRDVAALRGMRILLTVDWRRQATPTCAQCKPTPRSNGRSPLSSCR